MLALYVLSCICFAMVLLILIDRNTAFKVPLLHHIGSGISWFTRMAFKTDFIRHTIRDSKKFETLSISKICRLSK